MIMSHQWLGPTLVVIVKSTFHANKQSLSHFAHAVFFPFCFAPHPPPPKSFVLHAGAVNALNDQGNIDKLVVYQVAFS